MASIDKPPAKIEDYHVLPISLPALPSLPISATHYLYLKPHEPSVPTPESLRSLFLVNIPIDTTETHLKTLFSAQIDLPAGRILDVQFEGSTREKHSASAGPPTTTSVGGSSSKTKKRKRAAEKAEAEEAIAQQLEAGFPPVWDRPVHRSGSTAIVVFVDKASMAAALKAVRAAIKSSKTITWGEGVEDHIPPLGVERYQTHHTLSHPPKATLLAHVNDYMEAYNAREELREKELARKRQEPDEEGFVTVVRGGRSPAARMEDAKGRLEKQKEKQKGFGDFYRFQGRERRKERAAELVRKFEEDKEKVRRMRAGRGSFLPQ